MPVIDSFSFFVLHTNIDSYQIISYGTVPYFFYSAFKDKVTKKVSEIEDEYDLRPDSLRDYMVEEGPNLGDPSASKLLTQVCVLKF